MIHDSQIFEVCIPQTYTFATYCPGVEIGRQATLRWWYSKGCAGSNPVPGTRKSSYYRRFFCFQSQRSFPLSIKNAGKIQMQYAVCEILDFMAQTKKDPLVSFYTKGQ